MTKILHLNVDVTISELAKHRITIPAWELPVVEATWPEAVSVVEEVTIERALPDAADEFTRLATKYGPKNEDVPTVAAVFGNFGPGVRALEADIAKSISGSKPVAVEFEASGATKEVTDPAYTGPGAVAAGGVPVSELGLDEGGDPEINLDDLADLTGEGGDEEVAE